MIDTNTLKVGDRLTVTGYAPGEAEYKRKLLAMGLTKGCSFTVSGIAPLGDPLELEVRGYSLSLRRHEAAVLLLEVSP
jgi:ferrous iron transport protein A